MNRWFLCLTVSFFLFSFAFGQTLPSFFQPAGTAYGDTIYTGLDDGFTPTSGVELPSSFNFYGSSQSLVFVSSNGLLAFGVGDRSFTPQGPQAANKPIIALNWGDVDTRPVLEDGNMIYYRTETDTTRLSTLASDITTKLQRNTNIILQWAFIVTYYKVGYFSSKIDLLNTFQGVIARDSNNKAYVVMNYGQLQWGTCSAGFSLGDGVNYVELPGSRTEEVRNLVSKSNVGQDGQFIYDVSIDLQHPCRGVADGTVCDDFNACTFDDVCMGEVCVGSSVTCTALDQCHVPGTCNPSTGQCSNPNADNGVSCNDGNSCTQTDQCSSGVCVGSDPVTCAAASDQCHDAGTCNPSTGQCSTETPKNNGTTCNDGDSCTQTDTCQSGVCTGANPVICTASDQCHAPGTCDSSTGQCSTETPKTNGATCNDGDSCTQTDTCQSGVCTGSNPVICTALDQCHVPGTCNPSTGQCSNPNAVNGVSCDDGDFCTQTDTCQSGSCTGSNPVTCTALDQCHVPGTCDPSNGQCSNPNAVNGVSCNDGDLCTQTDTCQNGVCNGANPVICTAMDQCHLTGSCNATTGQCSNPQKMNGASCNDGNSCTQTDTCQSGSCTGSNPVICTALDQCHVPGTCNPSNGQCSNPNAANGAQCNDGNGCTLTDQCMSGVCVGANPKNCTALDQCHVPGTCNPSNGQCSNPQSPNGIPCDDSDLCTLTDQCFSGVCVGTSPKECTALDQCHVPGICDPSTGECSDPEAANGTSCDDGDFCTEPDQCFGGECMGTAPKICTALDECHVPGICDSDKAECSNPEAANGTTCDDNNACTSSDQCQSGTCAGTEKLCTSLDQCHTVGVCNPSTGQCSNPVAANGTTCNDGAKCTVLDKCSSGVCVGTALPCPDGCDSGTGQCLNSTIIIPTTIPDDLNNLLNSGTTVHMSVSLFIIAVFVLFQ